MGKLSPCIGDYEPSDRICNGDPQSRVQSERTPCGWRVYCAAFKLHLESTGKDKYSYVDLTFSIAEDGTEYQHAVPKAGIDRFKKACGDLAKRYLAKKIGKKKRNRANLDKRRTGPTPRAKRAAKKAITKRADERHDFLWARFNHFKEALVEQFGNHAFVSPGSVARPGDLYLVDHTRLSNYISVYCKTINGRGIPIVLLKFKPSSMTFDVELPVGHEILNGNASKAVLKKMTFEPIADGKFKSIVSNVDKERLALLAEIIAKLVDGGSIEMPEARLSRPAKANRCR